MEGKISESEQEREEVEPEEELLSELDRVRAEVLDYLAFSYYKVRVLFVIKFFSLKKKKKFKYCIVGASSRCAVDDVNN